MERPVLKYFKPHDFACQCGCGLGFEDMDPAMLRIADQAREQMGLPLTITSAARCSQHNLSVGGRPTSSHLRNQITGLCHALDFFTPSPAFQNRLYEILKALGIRRFGRGNTFLHADNDPTKAPAQWGY